jgi:hypothetical protein
MDDDLRSLLSTLDPRARDSLRRVLIRDHADRDAISSRLMRYRDQKGQEWADIIDFLTMYPGVRRQLARLLAEIDTTGDAVAVMTLADDTLPTNPTAHHAAGPPPG